MGSEKDSSAILDDCRDLAREIIRRFGPSGAMIATAESCTGGLIAGMITEIRANQEELEQKFLSFFPDLQVFAGGIE